MALTQLTDVFIPEVYMSYTAVDGPELTAFYESGVATRNAAIEGAFQAGGTVCTLPFWKDLDATKEPNYGTDDPSDVAVPDNVVAGEMIARIGNMNQVYSTADLVAELAGSNPMQRIRNRFAAYWSRQWQRRLLASVKGILADNVANDSADMVNDISIADGSQAAASNLFSRTAFTGAIFTSGDHFDQYAAIAVHSIVYKRMVDNEEIEFRLPAEPDPLLPVSTQGQPFFLGKRVIVDDSMPVVVAGGGYKYTSILFGTNAVGYGERSPLNPVFVKREELQANGAGVDIIGERKSWVIHTFGTSFLSAVVTGKTPSLANLTNALNWNRVVERKNVPLAFLITNG